jgi:two-component system chemotaxis response regulator CheB
MAMNGLDAKEPKYIIVAGASAGGLNNIIELAAQLNDNIDAAAFMVLHYRHVSTDNLIIERLQSHTSFRCVMAEHDQPIRSRHLYFGAPDKHVVIKEGKVLLGSGPQENMWRPSIDVLFRSAAAAYNARVIGIILSGLMNDGTSGMVAINRCGGTCIVQDPQQAEYKDMILSVLESVEVDYCVPLEHMGAILEEKTGNGVNKHEVPYDVKAEAEIAERAAIGLDNVAEIGEKSLFVCPDCGGGLWEMVNDHVVRYRCHTGHVYNANELLIKQSEGLENTFWIALRMMEERKKLLDKMAKEETSKGWRSSAINKEERAATLQIHIERLKQILIETKKD